MLIMKEGKKIKMFWTPDLGVLDLACSQAVLSSCSWKGLLHAFWLGHLIDTVEIFTLPFSFSGVCAEGAVSASACPAMGCEYGIERSSECLFIPANHWQCWMALITSPNLGWASAALMFDTSAGMESDNLRHSVQIHALWKWELWITCWLLS